MQSSQIPQIQISDDGGDPDAVTTIINDVAGITVIIITFTNIGGTTSGASVARAADVVHDTKHAPSWPPTPAAPFDLRRSTFPSTLEIV
jgi:hypothetical protein